MTFDYDELADVLYVSFGTGEPSFSEEIDDHMVMDIGMYTGAPTGFQLLHVKEAGIQNVQITLKKKLPQLCARKTNALKAVESEREQMLKTAVSAFPSRARELVHA